MCHLYTFISINVQLIFCLRVTTEACALLLAQNISKYEEISKENYKWKSHKIRIKVNQIHWSKWHQKRMSVNLELIILTNSNPINDRKLVIEFVNPSSHPQHQKKIVFWFNHIKFQIVELVSEMFVWNIYPPQKIAT